MTASALRPKTNTRRLLHFLGISLAVHVALLIGLSIGYIFDGKPEPAAEGAAPAVPVPAAGTDKPAEPAAAKPSMPAAPEKPKDADAEYQKRQKPASEGDKRKAEDLRPDLDQLK